MTMMADPNSLLTQCLMEKMTHPSYVVWNHKSGTGKSTMIFQLAAAYAVSNESHKVVVIDMCPGYNVSQTLLSVHPKKALIESKCMYTSQIPYEQSVSGYLTGRLERHIMINSYQHFLLHVKKFNTQIPENVYLLMGDHNDEALTTRLEQERKLNPTPNDNPWKRVTLFIKDFIEGLIKANYSLQQYCFFIDTDCSFSIYTQMAITAAKSLIVPFTADENSLSALEVMCCLLYGCTTSYERTGSVEDYFFSKAFQLGIVFPKLHLFILNKATYYTIKGNGSISPLKTPAYAFAAIRNQYGKVVYNARKLLQLNLESCSSFEEFRAKYIIDVHDFRSLGVLSTHRCCPFSKLIPGEQINIYDETVTIDDSQLKLYKQDIQRIVKLLENTSE